VSEETGLRVERVRNRQVAVWRERGVILIILTLAFSLIVPLIGLAFDCGMLYLVRTRLSAAVDAAVLAGGRSLNRGQDIASQEANAIQIATDYFNANFPTNIYGTTNITFHTTVTELADRRRLVAMNASLDAPLYFLRVLRRDYANVRVSAVASRRDVNLILLLDRSGSIAFVGAAGAVRGSAKAFVDKFAEGRDRLGLVSFSGAYSVDFAYGMDFKTRTPQNLSQAIDALNFPTGGAYTGSAIGLWKGYKQLLNIDEEGALNVVVFFTDGRPTAVTGDFPVKTVANDQRYGDGLTPPSSPPGTGTVTTAYGASSCTSSTAKFGFIGVDPCVAASCPASQMYLATGITYGVMKTDAASSTQNEWTLAPDSSNCNYAPGTDQTNRRRMRRDIAYIPDTVTYDGTSISTSGYETALDKFPTGHPYVGKVRPDVPRTLRYAANNVADNIAAIMRNNTRLKPIVFSIGMGTTSGTGEPIDHVFLRRLANDPSSPIYDSSKPVGLYVYSPTPSQLNDAFMRIASEILRLAQ
jgi:Flp pilus assembly protein TadG